DLVYIARGDALCDSRMVAEKLAGGKHARVKNVIEKLAERHEKFKGKRSLPLDQYDPKWILKTSSYRGQKFTYYEMNKTAFSMVAMRFKTDEAYEWQLRFSATFQLMEKALLNRTDIGWKQIRDDSKDIRLELTGCIKEFVEYAKNQGSQSAERYYGNITKMEYAALRLIEYKEKVPSNFRDTLDRMQLFMIVMAEHVANETIKQGMVDKLHYKEIFLLAKQAVLKYASTVLFDQKQIK
ncbi:Rha family transcriptional regulator, partial [Candidatus Pacearchaeota archaeon]|nr:Rha family transcriptional regulator [Candidatus Pacearchaeota archaeon]